MNKFKTFNIYIKNFIVLCIPFILVGYFSFQFIDKTFFLPFFFLLFCISFITINYLTMEKLKVKNENQQLQKEKEALNNDYQELLYKSNLIAKSYIELKGQFANYDKKFKTDSQEVEEQFKTVENNQKQITMKDVAGHDEVKEELKEIIDFLKHPQKYHKIGARIPKGVLFMGPPGTGKTLLARAIAGEADVKFMYASGSEFVEKFVGVGAARIRKLFKDAKKDNEPCIIFIDEIDAIGCQRTGNSNDGEKNKTLNQLLVEMDGFEQNHNIIVIAATNRKDILDSALLRPGRFDRQIYVGLPTQSERLDILKVHAKNKKLAQDFSLESLARKTTSFSGAQLSAVLNEAALLSVRNGQSVITNNLAEEAIDRVILGPSKKNKRYIEKEKKIVAYHEAGHAVAGLKLEDSKQVEKITIIPRGTAGGYNLFSEKEETFFSTKNGILAEITGLLSGRAAEEIMFNEVTSGASNDIERATELAKKYVCDYGMSHLGLMKFSNPSSQTSDKINQEINQIIEECYENSKNLLKSNKPLLNAIAHELIEKETIDSTQISQIAIQFN